MNEMEFNNTNYDNDWGFYVDIEKGYLNNSINHYFQKKIPDVIIPDASYCIDIYDFGEETDYRNYDNNTIYNECNLYNIICNVFEYYKNKFNTKNGTNLIIKVSSTTFATIALSYVILAVL